MKLTKKELKETKRMLSYFKSTNEEKHFVNGLSKLIKNYEIEMDN